MHFRLLLTIFCFIAIPVYGMAADFKQPASAVPLPPAEKDLQTVEAEHFFTVSKAKDTLEGAAFAKDGALYFCNPTARKIMRVLPDKTLTTVYEDPVLAPSGLAFHKDGRIFFTGLNLAKGYGSIMALRPDTGQLEVIIPTNAGYLPNDLVFDANGGFYFTDFKGSATYPIGGVYYMDPEFKLIKPAIPNMAQANGIALSPDGKILWATEYANNRLHRMQLTGPGMASPTGSKIPYYFTGPAPDSMRVDENGNVYVAMVGLGKVLVFNQNGLPIGQILLPGRDAGLNLRSTCLAIHPDKAESYIVTGNTVEADSPDANIYVGPAFARGLGTR